MIANKRTAKIASKVILYITLSCLIFGVVGSLLNQLGIINTEIGPKIISLVLATGLLLYLFTYNLYVKASKQIDITNYTLMIVWWISLIGISSGLIAYTLQLRDTGEKVMAHAVLMAIILFIDFKLVQKRNRDSKTA